MLDGMTSTQLELRRRLRARLLGQTAGLFDAIDGLGNERAFGVGVSPGAREPRIRVLPRPGIRKSPDAGRSTRGDRGVTEIEE